MANWLYHVKLKHLITDKEDHESIQASMDAIADAIKREPCFNGFSTKGFKRIPKGDDVFGPVDYANKLIGKLYNYADYNRIWIE